MITYTIHYNKLFHSGALKGMKVHCHVDYYSLESVQKAHKFISEHENKPRKDVGTGNLCTFHDFSVDY